MKRRRNSLSAKKRAERIKELKELYAYADKKWMFAAARRYRAKLKRLGVDVDNMKSNPRRYRRNGRRSRKPYVWFRSRGRVAETMRKAARRHKRSHRSRRLDLLKTVKRLERESGWTKSKLSPYYRESR